MNFFIKILHVVIFLLGFLKVGHLRVKLRTGMLFWFCRKNLPSFTLQKNYLVLDASLLYPFKKVNYRFPFSGSVSKVIRSCPRSRQYSRRHRNKHSNMGSMKWRNTQLWQNFMFQNIQWRSFHSSEDIVTGFIKFWKIIISSLYTIESFLFKFGEICALLIFFPPCAIEVVIFTSRIYTTLPCSIVAIQVVYTSSISIV